MYIDLCAYRILLRLDVTQVGLQLLNLSELGLGVLGADAGGNNDVLTLGPVDRSGNALLVSELESLNDTKDLGNVATGGSRVDKEQPDLLGRVNNEDVADGHGSSTALLEGLESRLVKHVVLEGNLARGVGNDGIVDLGTLGSELLDVSKPLVVVLDGVSGQANELGVQLGELGLELGESTQLGGADRSEVGRVGEKHSPLVVAQELVEVDLTLGGRGGEVRGLAANADAGLLSEIEAEKAHAGTQEGHGGARRRANSGTNQRLKHVEGWGKPSPITPLCIPAHP